MVPVVNLEYSDDAAKKIKQAKGYTSSWVGGDGWVDKRIEWQLRPPDMIKYIPAYDKQFFE